jgi:hypothetical protein
MDRCGIPRELSPTFAASRAIAGAHILEQAADNRLSDPARTSVRLSAAGPAHLT